MAGRVTNLELKTLLASHQVALENLQTAVRELREEQETQRVAMVRLEQAVASVREAVDALAQKTREVNHASREHEKTIALLARDQERHSVNWDRVANVVLALIQALVLAALAGWLK